jgi:hypothetical protein
VYGEDADRAVKCRHVPAIFICYRRDDSAGHTGRLRDALAAEFGSDQIFRDLDTIGPGDDFVQAMSRGIAACTVFLAVIGRTWLTAANRDGGRRLDDPSDRVRAELAEALRRGVRVIPVLVQRASMPAARDLPEAIRDLADRNAIELDDEGWQADVARLVNAIGPEGRLPTRAEGAPVRRPWTRWTAVVATLVVLAIAVAVFNRISGTATPPARGAGAPDRATRTAGREDAGGSRRFIPAAAATLPSGGEAAIGPLVYELLDAAVGTRGSDRALELRIRAANHGRYDATFSDGNFRLQIDDETHAPDSGLNDIVAAESTKESSVTFPLPASASAATLRITNGDQTAAIPIDLSGRRGLTAAKDRELRQAGKRTVAVPVDANVARLHFGTLTCHLRSASLHRYAHKLTLTLNVAAQNAGPYDVEFGDSHFRLLLGESARPPVSGVSVIVPHGGTLDSAIVFDLPLDTSRVVVRTRFGDVTRNVPLSLPAE